AAALFLFGVYYVKFSRLIDRRLASGAFADTLNIYSAPRTIGVGDSLTLQETLTGLTRSGYTAARSNPVGWYNARANGVEIFPGKDSYPGTEPVVLSFAGGKVARIVSLADNTERRECRLEPQLITNLSANHEKRRLVRFADIPPDLVHAVISVEDKRFFRHSGFDPLRMLKAAYIDLKDGRKEQGASTLSMQLARSLWLEPDKNWKRKFEELIITLHLEHRLTKQQIFENYANQVYLGRRGPFSINGFGEAAYSYFGKELSQITVPEAALLAGMIQRPSYYNPFRYPDRARERRNMVLDLMLANGYLSGDEYRQSASASIKLSEEHGGRLETSYFLDVVSDELQTRLDDHEKTARYIYSTLDPDLQTAAEEAVRLGMENVDRQLRGARKRGAVPPGQPQVALIALDPHTGEVKALVGGRSYGASQLNHALAMRQPGSSFKPFVYAAALETAIAGGSHIFTPASVIDDSPTTFRFASQTYTPGNFHQNFMGPVTLRTALAHSLNVATVKLAEDVGYDKVVSMARRAGLNEAIKPTPAVALGAYEATPLEIAGAYTVFANRGQRLSPTTVDFVRARDGSLLYEHQVEPVAALDPKVAYLMVNMLQEVLRSGTGAGVRAQGFNLPAAGKTGTSRDGWFAGFTSELLCVVWIGFDDNRDLNLEGARSALPVWAEFMKRAGKFRPYRDAKDFSRPAGLVGTEICTDSGHLATPFCPRTHTEVFIDGSQPVAECELHSPYPQEQAADRVLDPTFGTGQTVKARTEPARRDATPPQALH
ncbi:MAG: penicillin-binding protein 1A, partial [Terriglobia bacterium]